MRPAIPLDEVVLRSYVTGAAHMALGWVTSEALAVDAAGQVHDLTIRSFGILRAVDTPPIEVDIDASPTEVARPPVNVSRRRLRGGGAGRVAPPGPAARLAHRIPVLR